MKSSGPWRRLSWQRAGLARNMFADRDVNADRVKMERGFEIDGRDIYRWCKKLASLCVDSVLMD